MSKQVVYHGSYRIIESSKIVEMVKIITMIVVCTMKIQNICTNVITKEKFYNCIESY